MAIGFLIQGREAPKVYPCIEVPSDIEPKSIQIEGYRAAPPVFVSVQGFESAREGAEPLNLSHIYSSLAKALLGRPMRSGRSEP